MTNEDEERLWSQVLKVTVQQANLLSHTLEVCELLLLGLLSSPIIIPQCTNTTSIRNEAERRALLSVLQNVLLKLFLRFNYF